jgi:uncharacterized protein (TIGR02594 family)
MKEANQIILTEGFKMLGITEVKGYTNNNPIIVQWLQKLIPSASRDEISWCGASMYHLATKTNCIIKGDKPLQVARNWYNEGELVTEPKPGDLVVLWSGHPTRSWRGHIAIWLNEHNGYIWMMGGNQNNQWNVKAYPSYRVLKRGGIPQYRRLFINNQTI